jgi:hypothetical protein
MLARGLALGAAAASSRLWMPGLARAGGGWPTESLGADAALRVDSAQFMPVTQLADWQAALNDIGLRATASAVHARYADGLAARLERVGVSQVQTENVSLKRWQPSRWSIDVVGGAGAGAIPVAAYVPYSGQTAAGGVTAPLALAPTPGTIGLLEIPNEPLAYGAFDALDWGAPAEPKRAPGHDPTNLYIRSWVSQGIVEDALQRFQGSGVTGLIMILDLPAEAAQGMYMPYHGIVYDMPAVFVDRDVGARLQQVAAGGGSVRLVLEAETEQVTTPNIYGVIPGSSEELVILESHHDGTNGIEENGCEAILAMSQYLARLPRCSLPRTVMVLLSTGHFAGNALGTETFINTHRDDVIQRTAAALTVEHLGALEWLPDANGEFKLTGGYEMGGCFAGPFDAVISPARAALADARVTEDRVMRPFGTDSRSPDGLVWPGDGEGFWVIAGLPSTNFITGPTYLLNGGMSVERFIDVNAVRRQAIAFTNLTLALTRAPLEQLQSRRPDDPALHASDTSAGVGTRAPACSISAAAAAAAQSLTVRYYGRRHGPRGILVGLSVDRGTLDSVTVELRHGGELEARTTVQRITTQPRRVVLRGRRGRPLAPGRYAIVVREGRAVVARRNVLVAARTASTR